MHEIEIKSILKKESIVKMFLLALEIVKFEDLLAVNRISTNASLIHQVKNICVQKEYLRETLFEKTSKFVYFFTEWPKHMTFIGIYQVFKNSNKNGLI